MTYDIKTGDDTPALAFQLANPDATKPNLTGATITLKLVRVTDGAVVTAAGAMTAIAPAATSGQVQYVFPVNGYPVAGAYRGEISVVYSGGRRQTFPGRGFIDIQINAKL
jgi:hypothetical protein